MGAFISSSIREIYFLGNKKINTDWCYTKNGFSYIGKGSAYYYSEEKPTEKGNYWHYVNGEMVIWDNVEE